MSDYWRMIIAVLKNATCEGTDEEQEATWRIIEQIERAENPEGGPPKTPLEEAWDTIRDKMAELRLEPYIDDQIQITEIWELVEELLKEHTLENEPWSLKETILRAMYENYWFDEFGICDPMQDLEKAMCVTEEEKQKRDALRESVRRAARERSRRRRSR